MDRHDWTHAEADRIIPNTADAVGRIRAGLAALDPDNAALLLAACGAPLVRARAHLRRIARAAEAA